MLRSGLGFFVVAVAVPAIAAAQDEAAPELDFLEYLGSWDESDEEWQLVAEEYMGMTAEPADDLPEAFDAEAEDADDEDTVADESDDD